jgi:hypothetical protein
MELGSEEDFMKTISKVMLVSAATLLTGASYAAEINLTPDSCSADANCWIVPKPAQGGVPNPDADFVENLVGTTTQLTSVYKQDFNGSTTGSPDDESGSFANSYSTTFTAISDPTGATITYGSGTAITCPECYLVIKDGNNDPSSYVFALGNWDGTSTITMTGFWDGVGGSISHVEIMASEVPLPAAVWLFGSGLVALAGIKRRRKSA